MQYDILIIGGGMVGASLAYSLQHTNYKLALVDATPFNNEQDPRLIALNYSSYCLFNNLNLWHHLNEFAASIAQVHISERGHFGKVRLHASDLSLPALGYVVPAKHINTALNQAILTQKNLTIYRPATLTKISQSENQVELIISEKGQEKILESTIAIGADGSYSTVREQLDINVEETDYQQSALVTTTQLNRSHQHIAYERFLQPGAIAMLPLIGDHCATIWSGQTTTIQELSQLSEPDFLKKLQENIGYRLGRLKNISQRHVYPLKMIKAKQTIKGRVILVGNAAHTVHPIAAQGLNLALAEIARLAECISSQPLSQPNWQSYLDWQYQQQKLSLGLSHNLTNLFDAKFSLLTFARQFGMIGLDICTPAKRYFSLQALGRKNSLPKLLK
jgi:2-octaprenyl-6-methoxyphenol hydroxylase